MKLKFVICYLEAQPPLRSIKLWIRSHALFYSQIKCFFIDQAVEIGISSEVLDLFQKYIDSFIMTTHESSQQDSPFENLVGTLEKQYRTSCKSAIFPLKFKTYVKRKYIKVHCMVSQGYLVIVEITVS